MAFDGDTDASLKVGFELDTSTIRSQIEGVRLNIQEAFSQPMVLGQPGAAPTGEAVGVGGLTTGVAPDVTTGGLVLGGPQTVVLRPEVLRLETPGVNVGRLVDVPGERVNIDIRNAYFAGGGVGGEGGMGGGEGYNPEFETMTIDQYKLYVQNARARGAGAVGFAYSREGSTAGASTDAIINRLDSLIETGILRGGMAMGSIGEKLLPARPDQTPTSLQPLQTGTYHLYNALRYGEASWGRYEGTEKDIVRSATLVGAHSTGSVKLTGEERKQQMSVAHGGLQELVAQGAAWMGKSATIESAFSGRRRIDVETASLFGQVPAIASHEIKMGVGRKGVDTASQIGAQIRSVLYKFDEYIANYFNNPPEGEEGKWPEFIQGKSGPKGVLYGVGKMSGGAWVVLDELWSDVIDGFIGHFNRKYPNMPQMSINDVTPWLRNPRNVFSDVDISSLMNATFLEMTSDMAYTPEPLEMGQRMMMSLLHEENLPLLTKLFTEDIIRSKYNEMYQWATNTRGYGDIPEGLKPPARLSERAHRILDAYVGQPSSLNPSPLDMEPTISTTDPDNPFMTDVEARGLSKTDIKTWIRNQLGERLGTEIPLAQEKYGSDIQEAGSFVNERFLALSRFVESGEFPESSIGGPMLALMERIGVLRKRKGMSRADKAAAIKGLIKGVSEDPESVLTDVRYEATYQELLEELMGKQIFGAGVKGVGTALTVAGGVEADERIDQLLTPGRLVEEERKRVRDERKQTDLERIRSTVEKNKERKDRAAVKVEGMIRSEDPVERVGAFVTGDPLTALNSPSPGLAKLNLAVSRAGSLNVYSSPRGIYNIVRAEFESKYGHVGAGFGRTVTDDIDRHSNIRTFKWLEEMRPKVWGAEEYTQERFKSALGRDEFVGGKSIDVMFDESEMRERAQVDPSMVVGGRITGMGLLGGISETKIMAEWSKAFETGSEEEKKFFEEYKQKTRALSRTSQKMSPGVLSGILSDIRHEGVSDDYKRVADILIRKLGTPEGEEHLGSVSGMAALSDMFEKLWSEGGDDIPPNSPLFGLVMEGTKKSDLRNLLTQIQNDIGEKVSAMSEGLLKDSYDVWNTLSWLNNEVLTVTIASNYPAWILTTED